MGGSGEPGPDEGLAQKELRQRSSVSASTSMTSFVNLNINYEFNACVRI